MYSDIAYMVISNTIVICQYPLERYKHTLLKLPFSYVSVVSLQIGLNQIQIGIVFGIVAGAYALFSFPFGKLSDMFVSDLLLSDIYFSFHNCYTRVSQQE